MTGTIRYNLDPFDQYSDKEVWEALEKAHLKDVISKEDGNNDFDQGLLTAVDAEGDNFSVGEKQLICLSRALLRGNKILLLDEATSSLDTKSESQIQEALKELMKNRTTLVVAHRLSTIENADLILVLHNGEIIERGTHNELIERGEHYADLHRLQFKSS